MNPLFRAVPKPLQRRHHIIKVALRLAAVPFAHLNRKCHGIQQRDRLLVAWFFRRSPSVNHQKNHLGNIDHHRFFRRQVEILILLFVIQLFHPSSPPSLRPAYPAAALSCFLNFLYWPCLCLLSFFIKRLLSQPFSKNSRPNRSRSLKALPWRSHDVHAASAIFIAPSVVSILSHFLCRSFPSSVFRQKTSSLDFPHESDNRLSFIFSAGTGPG